MTISSKLLRNALCALCTSVALCIPQLSAAQEFEVLFRPACDTGFETESGTEKFGGVPAPGFVIETGEGKCPFFKTGDPGTLVMDNVGEGSFIDVAIVVKNEPGDSISRVRSWVNYDPSILEGINITRGPLFNSFTADEGAFSNENGQAMIEVNANEGFEPDDFWIEVATLQFSVIGNGTTAITFDDPQINGHTTVETINNGVANEQTIGVPGTLVIEIDEEQEPDDTEDEFAEDDFDDFDDLDDLLNDLEDDEIDSFDEDESLSGAADDKQEVGGNCSVDEDCVDNYCYENICRAAGFKIPNGGSCERDNQCLSLFCDSGVCSDEQELPLGSICALDSECESNICANGVCSESNPTLPNGSSCALDDECSSGNCSNGTCQNVQTFRNGSVCEENDECESGFCNEGICGNPGDEAEDELKNIGDSCSANSECKTENCADGMCKVKSNKQQNGESCIVDFQCESFMCRNGRCEGSDSDTTTPPPLATNSGESKDGFSILKPQDLRVTTEGNAAFLGWEPLGTSDVKGYNLYYGTTMGQYIQRKTVPGTENSITVRNLPVSTQYYFALKAVNNSDVESAFSDEVSVVIGDPDSSDAPLLASILTDTVVTKQPLEGSQKIQGETGTNSYIALFMVISAIIGTFVASRRQLTIVQPIK